MTFTFYTDTLEIKSYVDEDGDKQHIIEGYISTSNLDRVGDVVTKECLQDMAAQIKGGNIKLDMEHEAWTKSPNIVPIGKIVDARITDKGLWVKAIINSHSSRFNEVWMSIKSGFIDAFSIAYQATKAVEKQIGDKMVRLLDKVELLNVALTGNPANPECRIENVLMKSLQQMEEENKMVEEQTQEQAPEQEQEQVVVDNSAEVKSLAEEVKALQEEVKSMKENKEELKSMNEESNKTLAELKSRLEQAEKAMSKPQMKSVVEEPRQESTETELPKSPLSMIQ